jgi:hypothetical protein
MKSARMRSYFHRRWRAETVPEALDTARAGDSQDERYLETQEKAKRNTLTRAIPAANHVMIVIVSEAGNLSAIG